MSQTIATPPTVRLDSDVIGRPISRPEGAAKVSGAAKYAAEFGVSGPLWYAYVVSSPIAKGKIVKIHADEVLALPSVQQVFSHENVPSLAWFDRSYKDDVAPGGSPFRPLHSADIVFSQQPVALVVADTFELARYAASVLRIEYEVEAHNTDLEKARAAGQGFAAPKGKTGFLPPPKPKGDADKAYAEATHKMAGEYTHHAQVHNPMEMFATTVDWLGDGQKMTIYDKTQGAPNVQQYLMKIFGLSKEEARVISKYTGGGFGAGLRPQHQVFMAVLAALELKHSVRLTLTRSQMFGLGHRPHTIQNIKLAADDQGHLQVIEHAAFAETSQFEDETETVVNWSGILYTSPNSKFDYQLAKIDVDTPADMRAPGAATGNFAIESAIDEMAYAAGVDPLAFRLLNYTYTDPTENKPFSSKRLDDCYHEGAARFGWAQRTPAPRSMRDKNGLLVGWGMAGGCWDASMQKAAAKASLSAAGHLTVSSATNDQGAGTYVIMTQMAAQTLGLPMAQVTFNLGDTNMPAAPVQGGSWTANSVGAAVQNACQEVGKKLLKLAQKMDDSPLAGVDFEDAQFVDGHIRANEDISRSVAIVDILAASGETEVEADGKAGPNPANMLKYSMHSHNAAFVEVKVDEDLGTIHVTRVVNAVAAGRIMNPKTARSQILGGTVWGISMALMEEAYLNNELGRYMNHNYAEYHIPTNADIHKIDVIFVEEEDDIASPIGVKGVGEIGMLGVAAAICNAVYHATGKRVRELPLTIDKLL